MGNCLGGDKSGGTNVEIKPDGDEAIKLLLLGAGESGKSIVFNELGFHLFTNSL